MWSPDLTQQSNDKQPMYLRLVDALAKAIASGELAVGEKLPPQRQLAWHLNINLSTVTKAFHEATKQHLIAGEVGRGTYVLAQSGEATLFALKQNAPLANDKAVIDLSTHVPACQTNDKDLDMTLQSMISNTQGVSEYLHYHSSEALQRLQVDVSLWLKQLGYHIHHQHCLATATAQNALLVTLLASCKKDDWLLVNELTFPGMKAVAQQLGLKLYGVKMDHEGITPQALDLAIRSCGAKVLVSDPTWQNPTASTMSETRQKQIIALICQHKLLFIEEYVIGALSGIAPMSRTIQHQSIIIGSFAKTVAPGIRFAFIAGMHPIIEQLQQQTHATSWQLSPLMSEVACRWIESGLAKQRLDWQFQEVSERFRLFKQVFPNRQYPGNLQLCSHIWLTVNQCAEQAVNACRALGVEVVAANTFAVGRHSPNAIRVSLTAAKTRQQLKVGLMLIKQSGLVTMV